jgi:ABC-2 type transport system ATP-binding protein
VRDVIHDLKARGTCVFLNSHLLGEVEATCDRVVFMKLGRVVHELDMTAPSTAFEVDLRAEGASEATLAAHAEVLSRDHIRYRLRVANEETLPALSAALVRDGAKLYALTPHRRSLEATFLEVMGEDQGPG